MTEAARRQALAEAQSGRAQTLTLLDLVAALVDAGASETEVVATVTRLVNQGRVRLVGNFRGADVRIG
jgi:DNA-binding transcriptional regulator PaaX